MALFLIYAFNFHFKMLVDHLSLQAQFRCQLPAVYGPFLGKQGEFLNLLPLAETGVEAIELPLVFIQYLAAPDQFFSGLYGNSLEIGRASCRERVEVGA